MIGDLGRLVAVDGSFDRSCETRNLRSETHSPSSAPEDVVNDVHAHHLEVSQQPADHQRRSGVETVQAPPLGGACEVAEVETHVLEFHMRTEIAGGGRRRRGGAGTLFEPL